MKREKAGLGLVVQNEQECEGFGGDRFIIATDDAENLQIGLGNGRLATMLAF